MSFQLKTPDAHLYYSGEEVQLMKGEDTIRAEVLSVNGDTVSFRTLEDDVDIESLILDWRESFRK